MELVNLFHGCTIWEEVKVKLSLCFFITEHHTMKASREWRYNSTHYLTSELDGGEWSASRLGRFNPRERVPGTHWIGGWVGHRTGLEAVVKNVVKIMTFEV
jgi:hypothetical protein